MLRFRLLGQSVGKDMGTQNHYLEASVTESCYINIIISSYKLPSVAVPSYPNTDTVEQ